MLKALKLQGAAELAKSLTALYKYVYYYYYYYYKRIGKYVASVNPLSKLVQTVIQSQRCFSCE